MKAKIKIEKEVEIRSVLICIAPRYIGDKEDDDMSTDFPLLNEEKTLWVAEVNVDTGQIGCWPIGEKRSMHVKVCDGGIYTLKDSNGNVVAIKDGYVPNRLVPGSYGDYVELEIDENGIITNWPKHPSVSDFFQDDH